MKKMKKRILLLLFLVPLILRSQGFQVNLQGQKQQAMGSAGTALVQDAAILFYNPGGASFLEKSEINAGFTPIFARGKYIDANTNASARTNSPMGTPFSLYAAFGFKRVEKLKLGLAVYTPFGSTVQWEDGWTGRFALTRLELKAIFVQPTLSYKITDKIGIGAGFVYSTGSVNLQKDIPVLGSDGNYGHAELDGSATGFGYNAGIYFRPTDKLSFGLTYRSQVDMKVDDGEATFTVPNALATNFPNGKFTAALPLPQIASFGVAYKFSDKFNMAFDFNYAGWKAYDTLAFDYETNTTSLLDTKSARSYKNTYAFRLGGKYMVTEDFTAMAGISFNTTPVKDGYVTPETPDADRITYTAGVSYKFGEHISLDASFLFVSLKRKDKNLETNLDGTFKTNVCAPGIGFNYKF